MMLPHTGTSYSVFHVRHFVLGRYVKIDPFSFFIFSEDFEWHLSRRACLCFRKAVHMWWLLGVTYFEWYLVINGFIPHTNGFIFFTYHPRKQFFRHKLEFTIAIAFIFYSREFNFLLSARRFIIEGICIIHWNPRSVPSQFVPKEVEKAHRDLLKLSDLHVEYYQRPSPSATHPPPPNPLPLPRDRYVSKQEPIKFDGLLVEGQVFSRVVTTWRWKSQPCEPNWQGFDKEGLVVQKEDAT